MQALSSPPILEGKSVVLAAETGSGKTLAYLVPVISALLDAAGPGTVDLRYFVAAWCFRTEMLSVKDAAAYWLVLGLSTAL